MLIEKPTASIKKTMPKELEIQKNLLLPFAKKLNQKMDSQNKDMYSLYTTLTSSRNKLKKVQNFFENLPVSEELCFDEENTIPFNPPLLERSNLFFPDFESNYESKIQEEIYDADPKKKQKNLKRK